MKKVFAIFAIAALTACGDAPAAGTETTTTGTEKTTPDAGTGTGTGTFAKLQELQITGLSSTVVDIGLSSKISSQISSQVAIGSR